MRNGVQYGVDTADVLSTVAECDASASGGKGTTQVASAKALSELNSNFLSELTGENGMTNSNLKANFQAGVDSIYDACVAKGSTPASKSLSDVVAGINNIQTGVSNISCSRIYNNSAWDNSISYTYIATESCFVIAYAIATYAYKTDIYGSGSVSSSVQNGAVQKIDIPHSHQSGNQYVITSFVRIFYMPQAAAAVTVNATAKHWGIAWIYLGKLNF